ncbi:MAG: right-handed parallel beta-helix repeat-containing protein [Bryobacteraceae bacterium]
MRIFLALMVGLAATCVAATYEVGPGKPLSSLGEVPWATLQPGDKVLLYYRSAPYKEKFVICRQGTQAAPILIRGVKGPNGELPIVDGAGAVTVPGVNYWSESRGVIKVGGANIPADTTPRYITIENLDIRSARSNYSFTADDGSVQAYSANASPIYIEKGENITIRNCRIHDGGNGLFVASSDAVPSKDILIERNYLYDNGNSGSIYEHNTYTAAIRITFQYNRLEALRPGASGNNLKDRSAGLVVRYNWIEGGNRQLDLVDAEDSVQIRTDPSYRETHVYGNLLIEPDAAGNRQVVHYGGDGALPASYRNGYIYNNTIVSNRTDRTTLFRLSNNSQRCDARNNIFYSVAAGTTVSLLDTDGVLDFQHNWIKPGWVNSFGIFTGIVNNAGGNVEAASPSFVSEASQNYRLAAGASAIDNGTALHPSIPVSLAPVRQYVKHQSSQARPVRGLLDIGAYER